MRNVTIFFDGDYHPVCSPHLKELEELVREKGHHPENIIPLGHTDTDEPCYFCTADNVRGLLEKIEALDE